MSKFAVDRNVNFPVDLDDAKLLEEALTRAANRLDSYGRYEPMRAGPHERKAAAMRALRERLREAVGWRACIKTKAI